MKKKQLIINLLLVFACVVPALAYMENYPPHKFKNGKFKHLEVQPLVDIDRRDYLSNDKQIVARLYEDKDTFNFLLQDGKTVLLKIETWKDAIPYAVYQADLNKDGLKDFIVFSSFRGCGLAAFSDEVKIFLGKGNGKYQSISYETLYSDLEDFVDLDNDDEYEIITTNLYGGDKHNYWAYNIYEIMDYKLVNANAKFKSFPKFIWFTHKPNDKDTTHLTQEEKDKYINKINNGIKYGEVK